MSLFMMLTLFMPLAAVAQTPPLTNPYGLAALWAQGDVVARGTLLLLLLMSVLTWYVALVKWWEQQQMLTSGRALIGTAAASLAERMAQLKHPLYADLLASAQNAQAQAQQNRKLNADSWIAGALDDAADRWSSHLQQGMALLATVGSTSPFVGLFGTVWGIYHALTAMGVSGQASIDKVAGPVGEALIMTAMGLAVAVPAVLCYNWLLRRNRRIMDLAHLHGDKLHAELVMAVD